MSSFLWLIIFCIPAIAIAWDAKSRGKRWFLWFLFGISGLLLSIVTALSRPNTTLLGFMANLFTNPLILFVPLVVVIIYLATRPWRKPRVRERVADVRTAMAAPAARFPENMKTCSRCGASAPYSADECPNCHTFPFPSAQPSKVRADNAEIRGADREVDPEFETWPQRR